MLTLLLQGCENSEIAKILGMAPRTVKAHFNRIFLKYGIRTGIKRVKLAVLVYRERIEDERNTPNDIRQERDWARITKEAQLQGSVTTTRSGLFLQSL